MKLKLSEINQEELNENIERFGEVRGRLMYAVCVLSDVQETKSTGLGLAIMNDMINDAKRLIIQAEKIVRIEKEVENTNLREVLDDLQKHGMAVL